MTDTFPMLVNDPAGCERTAAALRTVVGERLIDPGLIAASEDVGELAVAAGVPCVYWLLGGSDPAAFAGATTPEQLMGAMAGIPSNHSPGYAPIIEPTLTLGVAALIAAAKKWLEAANQSA